MARRLCVYGTVGTVRTDERAAFAEHYARENAGRVQAREVVAAHSLTEAARLFGVTIYYARSYVTETSNPVEREIALADPGVVYWRPLDYCGDTLVARKAVTA